MNIIYNISAISSSQLWQNPYNIHKHHYYIFIKMWRTESLSPAKGWRKISPIAWINETPVWPSAVISSICAASPPVPKNVLKNPWKKEIAFKITQKLSKWYYLFNHLQCTGLLNPLFIVRSWQVLTPPASISSWGWLTIQGGRLMTGRIYMLRDLIPLICFFSTCLTYLMYVMADLLLSL